jgi:hypothetical protein
MTWATRLVAWVDDGNAKLIEAEPRAPHVIREFSDLFGVLGTAWAGKGPSRLDRHGPPIDPDRGLSSWRSMATRRHR